MAPQNIGRYRILRELGRGATATVYLARDPSSGRQVAVKILSPAFTAAPDFASRFEQTLTALTGLEHPYLLTPHDHGCDEEQYFIVARYLPGGTLADRMDGRPMLLAEVVPLLQRLAEALDAAHTAHRLHGDLHPAEVLFDLHERAYLADLGLAQLLDPVAGPSSTGTAAYMSPEQISGQAIDGRADVYALGVMLFEMLTGRQPYVGATPQDVLRQHLEQPAPPLSAAALTHLVLPLEFNLLIARALAKNRDYRYPTAGVLAEAVRTTFLMPPADSAAEVAPPPLRSETRLVTPLPPPTLAPTQPATAPPGGSAPAAHDATLMSEPRASSATASDPATAPGTLAAQPESAALPAPSLASAPTGPAPAAAPPVLEELVRENPSAAPPLRRGPSPGVLLLGLVGLGLVALFLVFWQSPNLRAWLNPPTATVTVTIMPTPAPTSTPSVMPSATAAATASLTSTAAASPTNTPSLTVSPSPTASPTPTLTASATLPPTDTAAPTRTPTRRPTLAPFTPTVAITDTPGAPVGVGTSAPTQSHLGPPPSATP